MRSQHPPADSPYYQPADGRADLDETLFAEGVCFAPGGAPLVPEEVVRHTLELDDPLPCPDPHPAPPAATPAFPAFPTPGPAFETNWAERPDPMPVPTVLPPGVRYHPPGDEPPAAGERRSVMDNGLSYELTSVAPGLFELRQPPPPAAAEAPAADEASAEPVLPTFDDSVFDEGPAGGAAAAEPPPADEAAGPVLPTFDDSVFDEGPALAAGDDLIPSEAAPAGLPPVPPEPCPAQEEAAQHNTRLEDAGGTVAIDPPPRVVPSLVLNTGLMLQAGETAAITPARLRLSGGEANRLDVLLLSAPRHGALVRDGFALTGGDVFTQDDIDAGRLHYRHGGGPEEYDSFTFATPDGDVPATVFPLTIEPSRRAPVLSGEGCFSGGEEGCLVGDVLAGTAECGEPGLQAGMAVVGLAGRGQWQFALGEGAWQNLPPARPGRAVLLRHGDRVRFVARPGWSGAARLTYHAWDQTTGQAGEAVDLTPREATGGGTAFSRTTATAAAILVAPPAAQPAQAARVFDPWEQAPTVAELVGGPLAVVRAEGEGRWQFSLDGGRSWSDFGTVYHGRARLLRGGDCVRFLPRRGAAGKVLLGGRAWDGTSDAAGATVSLAAHASHGDGTPFAGVVQTRTWFLGGR